jgi:hypothetical protein
LFGLNDSLICISGANRFGNTFSPIIDTDFHSCSICYSDASFWRDGVSQSVTGQNGNGASGKFLMIGARFQNAVNGYYSGLIHSVRLYSRALTADEIAANYAVDKARFNLPDAT